MGASMQGTLTSQRVLHPPPQAVPLLPHGRRLGFVQLRSELLMKKGSGGCNEGKPSFSERGGTALAVEDSRRVRPIGTTLQRSAQLIGSTVPRMGASMQGTLMSQRVLYPPPLARSPSFHMEGGLGSCKLVGTCSWKEAICGFWQ